MTVNTDEYAIAQVEGVYDGLFSVQNVFQMRPLGSGLGSADAVDDIVELLESLYTLIAALLPVLYVIQNVRIRNGVTDEIQGDGQFVDDTPGTGMLDVGALQVALGMSFGTVQPRIRGRKFFGPMLEATNDDGGVLTGASIAAAADIGDFMVANQAATNRSWQFGVFSSVQLAFLPFTSYTISPTMVTQRRRRKGVGS